MTRPMVKQTAYSWRGRFRAWWTRWLRFWTELAYGLNVEDDRGKFVPLVKRSAIGDGLSEPERSRLRTIAPSDPLRMVMIAVFALGVLFVLTDVVLYAMGSPILQTRFGGVVGHAFRLTYALILTVCIAFWNSSEYRMRGVAPCLKWGVCASCGYSLRDALEHDDGCVVCSECGAAWKASRVGAAARE